MTYYWAYNFKWPGPSSLQHSNVGGFQQLAVQTSNNRDLAVAGKSPGRQILKLNDVVMLILDTLMTRRALQNTCCLRFRIKLISFTGLAIRWGLSFGMCLA